LTGHGLKDPTTAIDRAPGVISCDPDFSALESAVLA
jgi:threonine synthase